MKSPIVEELKFKVFKSGDPLYLFIGLNVLVFLLISFVSLIEFFIKPAAGVSSFLLTQLAMPARFMDFLFKPWTLVTYMVTQQGLFHLLFNMLWLFWLGKIFLDFLNKKQFVFLYIMGGIAGGLTFLLLYNTLPAFNSSLSHTILLGSSASVSAIVIGTATLVPTYSIRLLLFGNVRLAYLAIAFIILDLIGLAGGNVGGNISHLGGALFGFLFIYKLKQGTDWSRLFSPKKRTHSFKKVYKNPYPTESHVSVPDQAHIDAILDKILASGYKSLTNQEKEMLFKASKKEDNK